MKYLGRLALCLMMVGFMGIVGQAQTPDHPAYAQQADIIAGQHTDVGDIFIWKDGNILHIEFVIDNSEVTDPADYWSLSLTHVAVSGDWFTLPLNQKNNPQIGLFPFHMEHEGTTYYKEEIDLSLLGLAYDHSLAIAAHAEVCQGGLEGVEVALPELFGVRVSLNYMPRLAMFPIVETEDGSPLSPIYYNQGWCADLDHWINSEDTAFIPATAYSSYHNPILDLGPDGLDLVDFPGNLDVVNWLLNQNFVGKPCLDEDGITDLGYGLINWVDVQLAIWRLLDDDGFEHIPQDAYDETRVTYLYDAALNHDGYVPTCGGPEMLWVLISPSHSSGEQAQTLLVPIPIPCPSCETAWGMDQEEDWTFNSKNWATYLLFIWE